MKTAHMHRDADGGYAMCARSGGLGLGTIWGGLRPCVVCFCPCTSHDIAGFAAFLQETLESGKVTSMTEIARGGPDAAGYRAIVAQALRVRRSGESSVMFDVYHLARRPSGALPVRRLSARERDLIITREVASARTPARR